jgi:6-phosphogluconolactonase (cycloisomerase 2 family)
VTRLNAYVGSRTTRERNARGDGISVFAVDGQSGALALQQVVGDLVNPSFLALNRAGDRLYAVHGDQQEVSAFAVDAQARLARINTVTCEGRNPVHLALDPQERSLVVSNHLTGEVAVLAIDAKGALGAVQQRVALPGQPGPHRKEQPFSKPHFNPFDPSGRFVVVPDKGLDRIFSFRWEAGRLVPARQPWVDTREGAGPRHVAFHPALGMLYALNELDSTVTAYRFDPASGGLQALQVLTALPSAFTGNSRAAEIEVSADGRWLYASNRGDDSIAQFAIDASGLLRFVAATPCGGRTPRFFTQSPDGRWLYVLNEDSDTIVRFGIDAGTGRLVPQEDAPAACGSPVCMVFRRSPP